MTTFLIGTDSAETSEKVCAYMNERVQEGDTVYGVNSLHGGDRTSDQDVIDGQEALDVLDEQIEGADTHQLIRGNAPQEDVLDFAAEHDVDELVIGIRKRSPTGKMLFGSTAQDLLLSTPLPVVCVPLTE
ncbi:universal stress protein [Natronomonas sp. EA1]|uniref:universal stress protein n=1 Tax=Natronomonas sp. EA1 TaxID=3421655 RepID=UPI003EBBE41D